MIKLSRRELNWIFNHLKRGDSVYSIAKKRGVSRQWIRHIRSICEETGDVPVRKLPGPKPCPIDETDRQLVLNIWEQLPLSPINMQRYLMATQGKKIPKNKIYRILKEGGKVKNEPKKQKRRKWVRYERRHSNSMWHVDWTETQNGRQLIVYEDDASRFITGWGIFERATLENAFQVFKKATNKHGSPKQLLSDNGSQFRFNEAHDRPLEIVNKFQQRLQKMGVKQIFTRPHHPQTNGKLERLNYTLEVLAKHFGSMEKAVECYNYRRPHMSLNMDIAETPYRAFLRKRRK